MNIGKKFERCIQKSVPDYVLTYRLPDSAQSFGKTKGLRFSNKSPFDFIFWDSKNRVLYALELKTVSEHSISFERDKEESGNIHFHQIEGLRTWNKYDGIVCGFIIEFRDLEYTFFISIGEFDRLISKIDKKSFNLKDLEENGIEIIKIPQEKVITNYRYDLSVLLG